MAGQQGPPAGAELLPLRLARAQAVPPAERTPEVAAFVETVQLLREGCQMLPLTPDGRAALPLDSPTTQQQVQRAFLLFARAIYLQPQFTAVLVGDVNWYTHLAAYLELRRQGSGSCSGSGNRGTGSGGTGRGGAGGSTSRGPGSSSAAEPHSHSDTLHTALDLLVATEVVDLGDPGRSILGPAGRAADGRQLPALLPRGAAAAQRLLRCLVRPASCGMRSCEQPRNSHR